MAISVNPTTTPIEYPSTDGLPMAETDFQRKPLMYAVEALDAYFRHRPDVYVSGNLFIYYEEGNPSAVVAPDVFVVFGAVKRDRSSYFLWREPKAPDFVLEITSKSTRNQDQQDKPRLYTSLGVREYVQYDPTGDYLTPPLQGRHLVSRQYQPMPVVTLPDGTLVLHSDVLGLELRLTDSGLRFFEPTTGRRLPSYGELEQAQQEAEQARQAAEAHIAELEARLRALQAEDMSEQPPPATEEPA